MKKIYTLLFVLSFIGLGKFNAQPLEIGTTAPNFTLTDTDGNEQMLYHYLGQGKIVVLYVLNTDPSLMNQNALYFSIGVLQQLYSTYGPTILGTDEIMVLAIETNPETSSYVWNGIDLDYYTDFPIISADELAEVYPMLDANSPISYIICPNKKIVAYVGYSETLQAYENAFILCPELDIFNDASISKIIEPVGMYCTGIIPEIKVTNQGFNDLNTLKITTQLDDNEPTVKIWGGLIETYHEKTITLDELVDIPDGDHTFSINISEPNGTVDENPENNHNGTTQFSSYAEGTPMHVSLKTDDWPQETSWDLKHNDTIIYNSLSYSEKQHVYNERLCLDELENYSLTLRDSYNDGMTAGGIGYLKMIYNNKDLFQINGNEFDNEIIHDFQVYYDASSKNNIVEFSLPGQASSIIDSINHAVNVRMANADFLNNKFAIFTLSDSAQAYVDGELQISYETHNDFTHQVVYDVVAEDGTSQPWNINVSVVSANEIIRKPIAFFPNPATDMLYFNKPIEGKLVIYNNIGEVVHSQILKSNTMSIDISNYKSGLYEVNIINGNVISTSLLSIL